MLDIGATINESPSEADESRNDSEVSPEKSDDSTPNETVAARAFETEKGVVKGHSHDGR